MKMKTIALAIYAVLATSPAFAGFLAAAPVPAPAPAAVVAPAPAPVAAPIPVAAPVAAAPAASVAGTQQVVKNPVPGAAEAKAKAAAERKAKKEAAQVAAQQQPATPMGSGKQAILDREAAMKAKYEARSAQHIADIHAAAAKYGNAGTAPASAKEPPRVVSASEVGKLRDAGGSTAEQRPNPNPVAAIGNGVNSMVSGVGNFLRNASQNNQNTKPNNPYLNN